MKSLVESSSILPSTKNTFLNSSNGTLYSDTFETCVKWRLNCCDDYVLSDEGLTYLPHEILYGQDEYWISPDAKTALVCIPQELSPSLAVTEYGFMYLACLSVICLLLSIVIDFWTLHRCRVHRIAVICHKFSLCVYLTNSTLLGAFNSDAWNEVLVFLNCYFLQATFYWLHIISYNKWCAFHPKRMFHHNPSFSPLQVLYGFGLPTVAIGVSVCFSYLPLDRESKWTLYYPLYGNIAQLIWMQMTLMTGVVVNIVFCIVITFNLCRMRNDTSQCIRPTDEDKRM